MTRKIVGPHPDIGRRAMCEGVICRVIGVTYGDFRNRYAGIQYHLMPEGSRHLYCVKQYVPVSQLAFDPPESYITGVTVAQVIKFPTPPEVA